MPERKNTPSSHSHSPNNLRNHAPVKINTHQPPQVNQYYIKIANKFNAAKYISFVFLACFIVLMLAFFRDEITYDNFRYLIKDIQAPSMSEQINLISKIKYEPGQNQSFALYHGDLILADNLGLTFYNSNGNTVLHDTNMSMNTKLEASSKYLLAYELGEKKAAVYNPFACVWSETFDYQILGGDISDSGVFAIITKSREYGYEVLCYNKSLKISARYYKDKYIIDTSIREDGGEIAILSADSENGGVYTEIMICESGSEVAKKTHRIDGIFPIAIEYFDDGNIVVVCDSELIFIGTDGEILRRYDSVGMGISSVSVSENEIAAVCNTNIVGNENLLLLFETQGNLLYNSTVKSRITDVSLKNHNIYMTAPDKLYKYAVDIETGTAEISDEVNVGNIVKLIAADNGLLVCTNNAAYLAFANY